jgi:hypothetical protein
MTKLQDYALRVNVVERAILWLTTAIGTLVGVAVSRGTSLLKNKHV